MKKLLTATCAITMLVSGHSMEGKYFLKKTWAYTKMGFGVLCGIEGCMRLVENLGKEYQAYSDYEKKLNRQLSETSEAITTFDIKLPEKTLTTPKEIAEHLLTFMKRYREIIEKRNAVKLPYLFLAILAWQSGRRDLKDIRELNEKEAAAQPAADNAN